MATRPKVPQTGDSIEEIRYRNELLEWIDGISGGVEVTAFKTIACPLGTNPVADSVIDTLTLNSTDDSVVITGTAGTDTINFSVDDSKIDHGSIGGLTDDDHPPYILVAGTRAFTGNQSFGDFNITNVGTIAFDGFLQDASGVPIIGTLGVAANDDLQIVTSGGAEIMLIEGDNKTVEFGRTGVTDGVCVAIGTNAVSNFRLNVKSDTDTGATQGIANFASSTGDVLVLLSNAVNCGAKFTAAATSYFVGNAGFGVSSPLQPIHAAVDSAATNTILTTLRLDRTVTGGGFGAAGIGTQMEWEAEDSAGTMRRIAYLAGYLDNATAGSTTGVVKLGIRNAGTRTDFANAGFERIRFDKASVIVNNDKVADCDFIVNGATVTNCLIVDVSADQTIFNGSINTQGGVFGKITTITNTYTVLATDETVVCNKATAFTVTLPTAVVGQIFDIKNIGAGTVTVDGAGADTIDGITTQDILQWDNLKIKCNAANSWIIL